MSEADASIAVRVEGLGRAYDDHYALVDLDASFPTGSITALLGPNGAGKSTLIGILSTRLSATEGVVLIDGQRLGAGPRFRRQVGFVGHRTMLYNELTARENLRFFAQMFGLRAPPEALTRLLERVGLGRDLDRPVSGFSRGMAQRLTLARALLPEPRLLLLDEPLTGLDQDGIRLALELFTEARDRGAALIMASHDLGATGRIADRALILAAGRKRYEGPATEDLGGLYTAVLNQPVPRRQRRAA